MLLAQETTLVTHLSPTLTLARCSAKGGFATIGGASVMTPYVDQARGYGNQVRDDATIEN